MARLIALELDATCRGYPAPVLSSQSPPPIPSQQEAEGIVQQFIDGFKGWKKGDLAVVPRHTRRCRGAWVVFYNTQKFLETGEFSHQLAGNGPIFVDDVMRRVHVGGTAFGLDHWIARFEAGEIKPESAGSSDRKCHPPQI
ncbi:MAG: YrhB family protein [Phycisphaerales bacterium]|nr:YrhB family protein [Phycisphaerales bacterium]